MEIPRNLSYEMLQILIGFLFVIFPVWFIFYQPTAFNNLLQYGIYGVTPLLIVLGSGLSIISLGIRESADNYFREKNLKVKEALIKEYKLDTKIKSFPKEYQERVFKIKKPKKKKAKKKNISQ